MENKLTDAEIIKALENEIHQKAEAEIERLKYCNETNISSIATLHEQLKTTKAEAYKEFVEKLCDGRVSNDNTVILAKCLLKELVGDK